MDNKDLKAFLEEALDREGREGNRNFSLEIANLNDRQEEIISTLVVERKEWAEYDKGKMILRVSPRTLEDIIALL